MSDFARLFTFEGRLNRFVYFKHSLLTGFVFVVPWIIVIAVLSRLEIENVQILEILVSALFIAAYAVFTASLVVRRLHDMGLSGWWGLLAAAALLALIPLSPTIADTGSLIASFVLLFSPGQSRTNRFETA